MRSNVDCKKRDGGALLGGAASRRFYLPYSGVGAERSPRGWLVRLERATHFSTPRTASRAGTLVDGIPFLRTRLPTVLSCPLPLLLGFSPPSSNPRTGVNIAGLHRPRLEACIAGMPILGHRASVSLNSLTSQVQTSGSQRFEVTANTAASCCYDVALQACSTVQTSLSFHPCLYRQKQTRQTTSDPSLASLVQLPSPLPRLLVEHGLAVTAGEQASHRHPPNEVFLGD